MTGERINHGAVGVDDEFAGHEMMEQTLHTRPLPLFRLGAAGENRVLIFGFAGFNFRAKIRIRNRAPTAAAAESTKPSCVIVPNPTPLAFT